MPSFGSGAFPISKIERRKAKRQASAVDDRNRLFVATLADAEAEHRLLQTEHQHQQ